jgi:AraC-like DNA-binding protein
MERSDDSLAFHGHRRTRFAAPWFFGLTGGAVLGGVRSVSYYPPGMILSRVDFRWRLLAFCHVVHDSLESLALKQGYRVNGVCQELGLSEAYFREIFLRDVGLTPKEWMQWERMVVARRMLVWGIDPLNIADSLGFSHPNSFRREFREVYGVSPVDFQIHKRGERG